MSDEAAVSADDRPTCFVISPIGEADSDIRVHADWVLKLIKDVSEADPYNYRVLRADEIGDPGIITSQIIDKVLTADFLVADLSFQNPNVFYELALAHAVGKPVIHMIKDGQTIPFDIVGYRAVKFSIRAVKDIENAKAEFQKQLDAIRVKGYQPVNPVTQANAVQQLAESHDSNERTIGKLMEQVSHQNVEYGVIRDQLDRIEANFSQTIVGTWPLAITNPLADVAASKGLTMVDLSDVNIEPPASLSELIEPKTDKK